MDSAPTWISVASAVGTILVAGIAAMYAAREHRNARESFMQGMREQWSKLQHSWSQILLAQHGPGFHYVDATPEERATAAKVYEDLREQDDVEPGYSAALNLRADVRPVTRFLSYAADAVLRGRWRMSEAYEILGPDLARHHKTLRMLAHREDSNDWLVQATEFNNFDEQDAVFLFAFLLRAEQCRRGDTYAHFMVDLAEEMRFSRRRELRQCIRRVKRTRRRFWLPVRVQL